MGILDGLETGVNILDNSLESDRKHREKLDSDPRLLLFKSKNVPFTSAMPKVAKEAATELKIALTDIGKKDVAIETKIVNFMTESYCQWVADILVNNNIDVEQLDISKTAKSLFRIINE